MGAVEAFTETFSIMLREKRIYVLVLVMTLILAPIGAYVMPKNVPLEANRTVTHQGGVIVEEYGSLSEDSFMPILTDLLKRAAPYILLAMVLSTIFEYAVVRAAVDHLEGKRTPLLDLLVGGLKRFPALFTINFLFLFIVLALIGIPLALMAVGILALPSGAVLVLIGALLLIPVAAFTTAMATLPIAIYASEGSFGSAFEAIHLSFKNVKTTLGFGFLLWVGALGISMVSAPISLLTHLIVSGSAEAYVSALLQAPFTALLYEFLWVAGVPFYRELRKREELKRVDEELAELGIDF